MRFIASMLGALICIGGWSILAPMMTETPMRGFIGVAVITVGCVIILEACEPKPTDS